VIFQKRFITFLKEGTGTRMTNLLKVLDLSDRVVSEKLSPDDQIDFDHAAESIGRMRSSAVSYLRAALSLSHEDADFLNLSAEEAKEPEEAYQRLKERVHAFDGRCFLAINKDSSVRRNSRSGGVFTPLSDRILNKRGAVYGCKMDGWGRAVHARATTVEERNLFRGSKYIQSEMGTCFRQVREDLKRGMPVLFSGTPCQIAGLKSYLSKEDTQNLLTVDIVCHGVPSSLVWNKYLDWMKKKYGDEIQAIDFRDKRYGWKAHFESVKIGGKWRTTSVFRILFYKHLILRPSCHRCPYANLNRVGDITIGDAWGIETANPSWNDDKGASLVIVNSEKGKMYFEKVQEHLKILNINIYDYLQPNLVAPTESSKEREAFWHDLNEKEFEQILPKYTKQSRKRQIKDIAIIYASKIHLTRFLRKIVK
jgi:coenzyme F420-reducing hydrogenase beta subunit